VAQNANDSGHALFITPEGDGTFGVVKLPFKLSEAANTFQLRNLIRRFVKRSTKSIESLATHFVN